MAASTMHMAAAPAGVQQCSRATVVRAPAAIDRLPHHPQCALSEPAMSPFLQGKAAFMGARLPMRAQRAETRRCEASVVCAGKHNRRTRRAQHPAARARNLWPACHPHGLANSLANSLTFPLILPRHSHCREESGR